MIIFSKLAKSAKSLFEDIASYEEVVNQSCALMDDNEALMDENLALLEENACLPKLAQEKNNLRKENACLIKVIHGLLAENNQLKKLARFHAESSEQLVDLNQFFSPQDVEKIKQTIATNPETKENWHTLTRALSIHDVDEIFRQIDQV